MPLARKMQDKIPCFEGFGPSCYAIKGICAQLPSEICSILEKNMVWTHVNLKLGCGTRWFNFNK